MTKIPSRRHLPSIALIVALMGLSLLVPPSTGLAADAAEYAPVPETAKGPAIPEKGCLVEEIRDGAYWVTEGVYQALFVTTGAGVIVVDAPPNIGEKLLAAIAEVTVEPITHFIYSHQHKDHVGAAGMMPAGTTFIGHEAVAARLARAQDPNRPVPTVTFADSYVVSVGNQRVELANKGVNHEAGSTFIYLRDQKVLMLVDVVFPGWVPFRDFALAKNIPGYFAAHDQLLEYDFDTFIGGHLTRLGDRRDVVIARDYINDIRKNTEMAFQTVDFGAIAQDVGYENKWLLFKRYLDAVAQACADETMPKWIDKLGGVDIFTFDHCWMMQEDMRIDY